MKILLLVAVVQAFNLVVLAWFNRTAALRILVLRQQHVVYKRGSKEPLLKNRDRLFWSWLVIGLPIPYGAPNATAHIERLIGTLRRECFDRMLIWNEGHLRSVLKEFVNWYNHGRVHQGLKGIPDPDPALSKPRPLPGKLVAFPVLNGLHHDYRLVA